MQPTRMQMQTTNVMAAAWQSDLATDKRGAT